MRLLLIAASAWVATVGCADPVKTRVICHNANCVEPTNPAADDTVDALAASLALVNDDVVPFDGVELDTFWDGAQDICVFAHDLDQADAVPATEAATLLGNWLRSRRGLPMTRSFGPFMVFVELKGHVGKSKTERHSEAQRIAHAGCALEVYEVLAEAATLALTDLQVVFTSFDPALLDALRDHPDMPDRDSDGAVTVRLGALQGIPKPLDSQTQPLGEFTDIDVALVHPQWLRDGGRTALRSMDVEVGFWMFQATSESLDAIVRYEPDFVTTSEAQFMDAWLR